MQENLGEQYQKDSMMNLVTPYLVIPIEEEHKKWALNEKKKDRGRSSISNLVLVLPLQSLQARL